MMTDTVYLFVVTWLNATVGLLRLPRGSVELTLKNGVD